MKRKTIGWRVKDTSDRIGLPYAVADEKTSFWWKARIDVPPVRKAEAVRLRGVLLAYRSGASPFCRWKASDIRLVRVVRVTR